MFLTDRVSVSAPRRTADGYLVADAKVARAGNVQDYLGSEVGRPDMPIVRVYRPADEVFSADAIHSYAHRPITIEHPGRMVDAENWKAVAVGQTGGDVVRDGEFVRVPLVLMDSAAVREFEAGRRELSMGYSAEVVFGDGVTPDGQPYDAVQRNLRMNHLAVVSKARGGKDLRIGDGRTPERKDRADNPKRKTTMSDNTRTVMVDGLPVECTDAAAIAIAKLQKQVTDADARHATEIADRDAKLAKAEAERDAAQAKVLTDAALDARVQARADLITNAKSIHDADYSGKSDADIRKAAVVAKLGDAAVAGKSEAYIDARFDILVEDSKKDPVVLALRDGVTPRQAVNDNGYAASVAAFNRTQKEA